MNTTYFITGGYGNLARQIAATLLNRGQQVVLLDLSASNDDPKLSAAIYISGDITDTPKIENIFEKYKPEYILHMASLLSGSSEIDRPRAWSVNALASFQLMELALQFKCQGFFFPSTIATYGPGIPDRLPEDYPQWPINVYGATKVAVERMGHYYFEKHNLDFRAVRLPFVISAYAPDGALTAYASHAFAAAVKGKSFAFPVAPDVAASTIYAKDVCNGILQYIQSDNNLLSQRVYNLHAFPMSTADLARSIQQFIPEFKYTFEPKEDVDKLVQGVPSILADESARHDWGWSPQYNLQETAKHFIGELRK